jgi:1-acyl-sn-glycerol-3-phosphate acyltransferase
MAQFDRLVGEAGLAEASRQTLASYIHSLEIVGQERISASGPLLLLSNHPGMSDTLALFSSIPRPDLRALGAERPFLRALANVNRQLIYIPDDPARRMGAVRSAINHLRAGGAILTFPAGKIEPDPAVMPGAAESLRDWSESISIFTRLVPQTQVVVVIVSGVIWEPALHHPITRLRRQQKDRERLAAALQLLALTLRPDLRPNRVRVAFSEPLYAGDPLVRKTLPNLTAASVERARLLIEACQQPGLPSGVPLPNAAGATASLTTAAGKSGDL